MRDLVILGSTGSIGVQALEIVAANPGVFNVVAISAYGSNPAVVIEQARTYKVQVIGVVKGAEVIREALPGLTVIDGPNAASEIAAITCEVVLNGITGSIGLGPTLAALEVGNKLALVHSEVTEVLEAIRKSKGSESIVEEIADVIIRLLDVYAAMRNEEQVLHSLDEILEKKININKERQRLHGNLF